MKELLYENFRSTIIELNQLSRFNKKKLKKRSETLENIKRANNLLSSNYSSLNLFFDAVKNYVAVDRQNTFADEVPSKAQNERNRLPIIEIKSIFDNLLQILNSEYDDEIYTMDRTIVVESPIIALTFKFRRAVLNKEVLKLEDVTNFDEFSNKDLNNTLNTYVKGIEEYVDGILYYHINLLFTKPKIKLNISDTRYPFPKQKSYIDKWIDCEVTIFEVRHLKEIDYWKEIHKRKLGVETIDKIVKHQKELFNEEVCTEIFRNICEIKKVKKKKRLSFIKKEITLIESFLNGDTSIAHTKRLKNRFGFICSSHVLIMNDNLILNKVADIDFVIYDCFESRHTDVFKAYFFIKYLKHLKKKLHPKKSTEKTQIKSTPQTFKELIPQKNKQEYILKLLEDLSITVNGKSILTDRKKGALRGVIEALREKSIIPNIGLHKLYEIIAEPIQLEANSKLDATATSEEYKKNALEYIKNNPFH